MFKIGEFSKLSNISVRSLRHYESLDLLSLQKADPVSGYRYYTASQLDRANTVLPKPNTGSMNGALN